MSYKFDTLLKILDKLACEAPLSYKTYHPNSDDDEQIQKARSLAFIHLLLKVKFGLTDFLERHKLITDETQDGGLDAYYIDDNNKKLYLIQSKFRKNSENFEEKSISADDLIKIEVTRITKGIERDSHNVEFNSKIKAFQEKLRNVRDIAKYEFIVILLGNVYKYSDDQIRRLIDNCNYEIIDAEKAYDDLIFPLATGTYYDPDEIIIKLELSNKERPNLKQEIITDFGKFKVLVIFVPTYEIGRVLSQYKNAILKYNPRNFLALKSGGVNQKIKESITNQSSNNFAILNNGITILSENCIISEITGRENEGQLILTKPQILNGGQTAFTLSEIYSELSEMSENPLNGKEVLLKVITPLSGENDINYEFVELISNATNQQNEVSEADRRSNHSIQIDIQKYLFSNYGYFYERKAGEFFDGIREGIIDKNIIVDRLAFIKAYWAYLGEPAAARRTSEKNIFKEEKFYNLLHDTNKYREMFFAYLLFMKMEQIEKSFKDSSLTTDKYGFSLMYGKWAVVASIGIKNPLVTEVQDEIFNQANELIEQRLNEWKKFDLFVKEKNKTTKYFKSNKANYELYYKVNLLDEDIKEYFLR